MKFFAVLFVWNEADIIAATVKNLLCQGVERVFLIDNGSTDGTIREAEQAGASCVHRVDTGFFDEKLKYTTLNAVIARINTDIYQSTPEDRVWWMIVDADEFPETGQGGTIRALLESCPDDVRLVPAELWNHAPTHAPYYVPGYHPADFQPLVVSKECDKLPLLRYDKGTPHIVTMGGAHTYMYEGGYLTGIAHKLPFHHFKFREKEKTLRRLQDLTARRPDGSKRVDPIDAYGQRVHGIRSDYWNRLEQLDHIYAEHHLAHIRAFPGPFDLAAIPRWYAPNEINLAGIADKAEALFCLASFHLYGHRFFEASALFARCLKLPIPPDTFAACEQALALCEQ